MCIIDRKKRKRNSNIMTNELFYYPFKLVTLQVTVRTRPLHNYNQVTIIYCHLPLHYCRIDLWP